MDSAIYLAQRTASSSSSNAASRAQAPAPDPADQDDQYIQTFFCRALYDYQTNDASSLSFHRNDIIEVLTRLESGWWDGLLGEERGWFPSNYVERITDQEAEAALSTEYDVPPPASQDDSMVDMAHSMASELSIEDREDNWLERETEYAQTGSTPVQSTVQGSAPSNGTHPHDFWIPEVSSDGRVSLPSVVTATLFNRAPSF